MLDGVKLINVWRMYLDNRALHLKFEFVHNSPSMLCYSYHSTVLIAIYNVFSRL